MDLAVLNLLGGMVVGAIIGWALVKYWRRTR